MGENCHNNGDPQRGGHGCPPVIGWPVAEESNSHQQPAFHRRGLVRAHRETADETRGCGHESPSKTDRWTCKMSH